MKGFQNKHCIYDKCKYYRILIDIRKRSYLVVFLSSRSKLKRSQYFSDLLKIGYSKMFKLLLSSNRFQYNYRLLSTIIYYLSNTGPDPLKNHKATKPAFIVPLAKRHLNGVSLPGRRWSTLSGIWILSPFIN